MSGILEKGTALLARQPIFDDQKRVFGYELLYRGSHACRGRQRVCGNGAGHL